MKQTSSVTHWFKSHLSRPTVLRRLFQPHLKEKEKHQTQTYQSFQSYDGYDGIMSPAENETSAF